MLKEEGFLAFLEKMVFTGQVTPEEYVEVIDGVNEESLVRDWEECDHIYKAQRADTESLD